MTDLFMQRTRHSVAHDWFNIELKNTLGIDVYNQPFDKKRGWAVINHDNISVLVLKAETSDWVKEHAIADFTKLSGFRLANRNGAQNKDYAQCYREFLRRVELPPDYVNWMYSSNHVRHFYTTEKIQHVYTRWQQETPPYKENVCLHAQSA